MKTTMKRLMPALLLLLASLILGSLAFVLRPAFSRLPWVSTLELQFPRAAALMADGSFTVVDRGDRRIANIGPDGKARWILEGGLRKDGFYTCSLIGQDPDGTVWIQNDILDSTGSTAAQEYRPISPGGVLGQALVRRDYAEGEREDFKTHMFYPEAIGDSITWVTLGGERVTELWSAGRDTDEAPRRLATIADFDGYTDTAGALVDPSGTAWFLLPDGTILVWRGKELETFFDPATSQVGPILGPTDLTRSERGTLVFLDDRRRVIEVDHEGKGRVAWEPAAGSPLEGAYIPGLYDASEAGIALVDQERKALARLSVAEGVLSPPLASFSLDSGSIMAGWIAWGSGGLAVLGLLAALTLFYFRVAQRRTPILAKQLLIFVPLSVSAVIAVAALVYGRMEAKLTTEIEMRLSSWGWLGSKLADPADLAAIDPRTAGIAACFDHEAYPRLTASLETIVNRNADPWNKAVYNYFYIQRGTSVYVFDQWDYFERYLPPPEMLASLKDGTQRIVRYRDAYSGWYSSFTPVTGADGTVAGLLEITVDQNIFDEARATFVADLATSVAIIALVMVLAISLFTLMLLRSLSRLNTGATQLSRGEYHAEVSIATRDEIADLGQAFNTMAREIRRNVETVTRLNQANSKFVPSEFLRSLGHQSILDVKLGDQVERKMTVFFSDIRGFTEMSERMSPEDNFRFINDYLRSMGPQIRTAGGFIDKYIGDAIMALFPRSAEDAVNAALALFSRLERFPEINIGVGIHTGKLMLGVIGEEERYDGTVISDAVNLASRLESLCKYYGVSILVSGQSLGEITNHGTFHIRLIDRVRVKGRDITTDLHEVIPPGSPGAAGKVETMAAFAEAWSQYAAGRVAEAETGFGIIVARNPHDKPALLLLERCRAMARLGLPPGWDGITKFNEK